MMTMYRPTVRYSDVYKDYVDSLFQSTTLDRSQIIRAALFVAGHSDEFLKLLADYRRSDVPPPSPTWSLSDRALWLESSPKIEREGEDVRAINGRETSTTTAYERDQRGIRVGDRTERRPEESNERREGAVSTRTEKGGITIRIG